MPQFVEEHKVVGQRVSHAAGTQLAVRVSELAEGVAGRSLANVGEAVEEGGEADGGQHFGVLSLICADTLLKTKVEQ